MVVSHINRLVGIGAEALADRGQVIAGDTDDADATAPRRGGDGGDGLADCCHCAILPHPAKGDFLINRKRLAALYMAYF